MATAFAEEEASVFTLGCLERCLRKHDVGGPFFTVDEYRILTKIVKETKDVTTVPCRVANTARHFYQYVIINDRRRDFYCTNPVIVICRNSLGFDDETLKEFADMRYTNKQSREWNVFAISFYFTAFLLANSIVTTEDFIMKKCFRLPYCKEHDYCRRVRVWITKATGPRQPDTKYFTCCEEWTCRDITSLHYLHETHFVNRINSRYAIRVDSPKKSLRTSTTFQYVDDEAITFYMYKIFIYKLKTEVRRAITSILEVAGLDSSVRRRKKSKIVRKIAIKKFWLQATIDYLCQ